MQTDQARDDAKEQMGFAISVASVAVNFLSVIWGPVFASSGSEPVAQLSVSRG